MWRPKDWKNPYPDLTEEAITEKYLLRAMEEQKSNYEIYEAGAGAMSEALKKEGQYLNGDTLIPATDKYPEIHCPGGMVGWLVLIPDEN